MATSKHGKKYFTQVNACCLVAEEDGKLVGYLAAGSKQISYRKSTYIELENMGVLPGYRSMGIGTKLIQSLLTWAKTHGYKRAFVNAYFGNHEAIEFYKRMVLEKLT